VCGQSAVCCWFETVCYSLCTNRSVSQKCCIRLSASSVVFKVLFQNMIMCSLLTGTEDLCNKKVR